MRKEREFLRVWASSWLSRLLAKQRSPALASQSCHLPQLSQGQFQHLFRFPNFAKSSGGWAADRMSSLSDCIAPNKWLRWRRDDSEEVVYREEVCTLSLRTNIPASPRSPCITGPRLPIWKKEEKGGNLIKTCGAVPALLKPSLLFSLGKAPWK